jgi:hypothetical protein
MRWCIPICIALVHSRNLLVWFVSRCIHICIFFVSVSERHEPHEVHEAHEVGIKIGNQLARRTQPEMEGLGTATLAPRELVTLLLRGFPSPLRARS